MTGSFLVWAFVVLGSFGSVLPFSRSGNFTRFVRLRLFRRFRFFGGFE